MQRAAGAALAILRERWPVAARIAVICGGGNNAGDGFVLARLARAAGLQVLVACVTDPQSLRGDAARAYADWQAGGNALSPVFAALNGADVVVDALLGIGVDRDLAGDFAAAVEMINAPALENPSKRRVLALDIPSGLDADSGEVHGVAVRADVTVSFIAGKPGLWLGQGPEFCGVPIITDLGLTQWPDAVHTPVLEPITQTELESALPRRNRGANKGRYGHVLVVGGGLGMLGAARICAEAALRSGAGLVSVATRPEHAAALAAGLPEVMARGVTDAAQLRPLLEAASVIAVGPGLGRDEWGQALWSAVAASDKPLVVDADALNLLALAPRRRSDWILTPHPGEAGRLLGISTAEVQAKRMDAVVGLTAKFGGTAVLKGAGTLVAAEHSAIRICTAGNPGMAIGGMGDALTGVIAGLRAQLKDSEQAARLGVFAHATAGDRAARNLERGMLAGDLIGELRACLNPS